MVDDLTNTEFAESVHMIYWGNIFKFHRLKTCFADENCFVIPDLTRDPAQSDQLEEEF